MRLRYKCINYSLDTHECFLHPKSTTLLRLAVTSRPILVVLNKVDLLRGDNAIGGQKEMDGSEPVASSVDTYNGNDVRTPEAKMSFKKKLLQRKRDAMLQEEQSAVSAGSDSSTSGIIDPESISAAVRDIESGDVSVTVAEPVKAGAKAFQGNTEYAEYKDEYNEQEGGDARYRNTPCEMKQGVIVSLKCLTHHRHNRNSSLISLSDSGDRNYTTR